MNTTNIRRLNLNLLSVLYTLGHEQNVSRAAKKLHVTQAALSHSLQQLREIFNDELFIRQSKGMVPTQLTVDLIPQIKDILFQTEHLFTVGKAFDPSTAKRTFKIGMSDQAELVIFPELYKYLLQHAPGITLEIKHVLRFQNDPKYFESRDIELGIGHLNQPDEFKIGHEHLITENAYVITRKGHPLTRQKFSLSKFVEADHIALRYAEPPHFGCVELFLNERGLKREIKVTVSHFSPIFAMLQKSDLVAVLPSSIAKCYAKNFDLHIQPFCEKTNVKINIYTLWPRQYDQDPGHRWLRTTICDITRKLLPELVVNG